MPAEEENEQEMGQKGFGGSVVCGGGQGLGVRGRPARGTREGHPPRGGGTRPRPTGSPRAAPLPTNHSIRNNAMVPTHQSIRNSPPRALQ